MVDVLRRREYFEGQVLIETDRILDPQFKSTIVTVSGAQLELLRNLMAYLNRESTFVSQYGDRYYLTPTVSEWDNLLTVVASLEEKLMLVYVDDYVCVRDVKAQNTPGGDFASGAWRTRDINEELADAAAICDINSNQITLSPGTYTCHIAAVANRCSATQVRLYNITDAAVLLLGLNSYHDSSGHYSWPDILTGPFTLTATKVLEVQHRCQTTRNVDGFGVIGNWGDEIYTIAEFWRTIG